MKKTLVLLLTILMVFASVAACAEETIATKTPEKDPYKDPIKIAWIPCEAEAANGAGWGEGIRRELSNYSNVTFNIFDGENSADTQTSVIYDLINQDYDAIILQAYDSAALAAPVREAEEEGIPVICINIDASTPHAGLVSMTDYEAGYAIANQIGAALNGTGKVVELTMQVGSSRSENLSDGFYDCIDANWPELEVLDSQVANGQTELGIQVMNDFITAYGEEIDAVFAHNDASAEGAAQACQAAGISDLLIWGANGETKALNYIEEGLMTGTIYTNIYDQGATAARLAMMYIGGNIDTSTFTQTPLIKMAPIAVTIDNVASIAEADRW